MQRRVVHALVTFVAALGGAACNVLTPSVRSADDPPPEPAGFLGMGTVDSPLPWGLILYFGSLALGLALLATRPSPVRKKLLIGTVVAQLALHVGVLATMGKPTMAGPAHWGWDELYHASLNALAGVAYVAIVSIPAKTKRRKIAPTPSPSPSP